MLGGFVPRALKANAQAKLASSMGVWMASKVTLVGCSCRDHNTLEPLISLFDTWVVENVAAGLNFDRRRSDRSL